jgi:hypothetical protein
MFNFARVRDFFSNLIQKVWDNKKLSNSLNYVEELIPKIAPFIKIAGDIITGLTPNTLDDAAWLMIKSKYPGLFNGETLDDETKKLYALGIATDLVKSRFPEVSTTVARSAAQIAYLLEKNK